MDRGFIEVLVEGRSDKKFFDWVIRRLELPFVVEVFAVNDRVNMTAGEVLECGEPDGARGRVVATAAHAQQWPVNIRNSLTCIIDADHGHFRDAAPSWEALIATEHSDREGFYLTPKVLDKVLLQTFGLTSPTGDELLKIILRPLVVLSCVRAALHNLETGISIPDDYAKKNGSHLSSIDSLIRRLRATGLLLEVHEAKVATVAKGYLDIAGDDEAKYARGHDIAPVIKYHLGAGTPVSAEDLERVLYMSLDWTDLATSRLIIDLRTSISRGAAA